MKLKVADTESKYRQIYSHISLFIISSLNIWTPSTFIECLYDWAETNVRLKNWDISRAFALLIHLEWVVGCGKSGRSRVWASSVSQAFQQCLQELLLFSSSRPCRSWTCHHLKRQQQQNQVGMWSLPSARQQCLQNLLLLPPLVMTSATPNPSHERKKQTSNIETTNTKTTKIGRHVKASKCICSRRP